MITFRDLRALRVSTNAVAVAVILLDVVDHRGRAYMRTADLAEELGISRPTVQRAVTELITAGFMTRIVRGVYQIGASEESSSGSEERSPVNDEPLVYNYYKPMANGDMTKTATQSLERERSESPKGITMRTYDDGDDLGGVGMVEPRPDKSSPKPKGVPNLHRNVPREEWTMAFVVKEFKHRMFLLRRQDPKIEAIIGDDLHKLAMALRKWKSEYGLTPQEAAELCDRFFDDPAQVARIGNEVSAYRLYLQFVKMNVDSIRKTMVTDDLVEYVASQELPW